KASVQHLVGAEAVHDVEAIGAPEPVEVALAVQQVRVGVLEHCRGVQDVAAGGAGAEGGDALGVGSVRARPLGPDFVQGGHVVVVGGGTADQQVFAAAAVD